MFLLYRNQFIDLLCKSMDWFLYDRDLRHEGVNAAATYMLFISNSVVQGEGSKLAKNEATAQAQIALGLIN